MPSQPGLPEKTAAFRALHQPGEPFIIPNPWDAGSARILEGLGFKALATTSSGFALTKGRRDYGVTRDELLEHCRTLAATVDIPVTADLENGFGPRPEDAHETIRLAAMTGLCGGSIEDSTGDDKAPVFDASLAVDRIAAAVDAASGDFVLTARAEAFLYGDANLDDVIARLQAFEAAGADVLYAPGLRDMDAVQAVCAAVSKPVNVLLYGELRTHSVEDFADAGAARLSVGGALAWSCYGALSGAADMLENGRFDALSANAEGAKTVSPFLQS